MLCRTDVDDQRSKIQSALDIFESHDIKPDAWVAPAHSFDRATLEVLNEKEIKIFSDGIS